MTKAEKKELDALSKRRCRSAIDRRFRRWNEAQEARRQSLRQKAGRIRPQMFRAEYNGRQVLVTIPED